MLTRSVGERREMERVRRKPSPVSSRPSYTPTRTQRLLAQLAIGGSAAVSDQCFLVGDLAVPGRGAQVYSGRWRCLRGATTRPEAGRCRDDPLPLRHYAHQSPSRTTPIVGSYLRQPGRGSRAAEPPIRTKPALEGATPHLRDGSTPSPALMLKRCSWVSSSGASNIQRQRSPDGTERLSHRRD